MDIDVNNDTKMLRTTGFSPFAFLEKSLRVPMKGFIAETYSFIEAILDVLWSDGHCIEDIRDRDKKIPR